MRISRLLLFVVISTVFAFAGCSEVDLNSIHIALSEDGSGSLVLVETRVIDNAGTFVSNEIRGMDWDEKGVRVTCHTAKFKKIGDLDIAGIKMETKGKLFRMTVPLGVAAKWPGILAPEQKGAAGMRKAAKEHGLPLSDRVKRTFKFAVKVPGKIVAQGSCPKLTLSASLFPTGREKDNVAELVLPVKKILEAKDRELVWEVTWK
jgi:hypothetical protein